MMLQVASCVALLACINLASVDSAYIRNAADCTTYPCLVFEDNFEFLDFNAWEHEITAGGGGNWEFQYYGNNRSNSYTRDSTLFIKPTLTTDKYGDAFLTSGTLDIWGSTHASVCTGNSFYGCLRAGNPTNIINPIQSARLRTTKSFGLRYGRVEVRAKMPTGDWLWPAIWMMPTREGYGLWPASGEIDIVEGRGNLDYVNELGEHRGVNSAGATMHWGPYFPLNGYTQTTGEQGGDYGANFHTFGVEWTATSITLSIDGNPVVNVNPPAGGFWQLGNFGVPAESNPWRYSQNQIMAPFDQEFYFLVNLAVGGTNNYFPDTWTNRPYPKPWSNLSPQAFKDFWDARANWLPTWNLGVQEGENAALQIDYIRAYKLAPDPVY